MIPFLKFCIIAIIMLTAPGLLFPQIKTPVIDNIPDINFNAVETTEKYKVKVTLYGKEPLQGEIILNAGSSINPLGGGGRIYPFSDIVRISVTMWSKQRRGSGWVFYPECYEIILRDNTRLVYKGNLEFLNRIRFTEEQKKTGFVYTYFYDYFKQGKWINTGTPGEQTLPSRPASGTLYIIELK